MNTLKQINEIFEARKEFKEGIFLIAGEEQEFKGIYKDGNLSNGWHHPFFPVEEAKKILASQDKKEDVICSGCSYYEFSKDYYFLIETNIDGQEIHKGIVFDGVVYFPIGLYNWVWIRKTNFYPRG